MEEQEELVDAETETATGFILFVVNALYGVLVTADVPINTNISPCNTGFQVAICLRLIPP